MEKYDWLIVGSGLFGSTFANLAKKEGQEIQNPQADTPRVLPPHGC